MIANYVCPCVKFPFECVKLADLCYSHYHGSKNTCMFGKGKIIEKQQKLSTQGNTPESKMHKVPFVSPEGSGSASEARCGCQRPRQVLANGAARGGRQPGHAMRRGLAEQPEHGGSHRQNCTAPCRSEWVPGGEAHLDTRNAPQKRQSTNTYGISARWWSCCWIREPTWVPSIRRSDSPSTLLLTWVTHKNLSSLGCRVNQFSCVSFVCRASSVSIQENEQNKDLSHYDFCLVPYLKKKTKEFQNRTVQYAPPDTRFITCMCP